MPKNPNLTLKEEGYLVIPNFLSSDECCEFREWTDKLFMDEPDPEGLEIECYNRLRIAHPRLTNLVTARLHEIFPDVIVLSKWFPTKYIVGGGLGIHIDGCAVDDDITSTYTILIYINSNNEFSGGRLVFVEDYTDSLNPTNHPPNNIITHDTGMAIILEQDKLHFAEPLNKGVKYMLRGDIHIMSPSPPTINQ